MGLLAVDRSYRGKESGVIVSPRSKSFCGPTTAGFSR